jgi:hypothetical protein
MVNCHASIKGLFGGMIVFSCTTISIILYAVFRNKTVDSVLTNSATISYRQHSLSSIIPAAITATHNPFTSISNNPKRIDYSIALLEIVNLCLLALSLCATMWSLIKIRRLKYHRTTTRERQKRKNHLPIRCFVK